MVDDYRVGISLYDNKNNNPALIDARRTSPYKIRLESASSVSLMRRPANGPWKIKTLWGWFIQ